MSIDSKSESTMKCLDVIEYMLITILGIKIEQVNLVTAEGLVKLLAGMVSKNWEKIILPGEKRVENLMSLVRTTEAQGQIEKKENGETIKYSIVNVDGQEQKIPFEFVGGSSAVSQELYGTSIVKIFFERENKYYLERIEYLRSVIDFCKNKGWTRNDLLSGTALLMLSIEQFTFTYDSTAATYKMRKNGEQSGNKRNRDPSVLVSTENVFTAHMAGVTLPGRLQKAIRTNIGAGAVLCEAAGASIKLLDKEMSKETRRFAEQSLETSLEILNSKLNSEQMNLAKHLKSIKNENYAIQILSMVGASLDAVIPRIDKPCIPHPIFLLLNKGKMTINNIYSSDNLLMMQDTKVKALRVPGFLSEEAIVNSLCLSAISNVYGPLELVSKFFDIDAKTRVECIGDLGKKISRTVKIPSLKKNKPNSLIHFKRGVPSATNHQSAPSLVVNEDSQIYVVHNLLVTKTIAHQSFSSASSNLLRILRNPNLLKAARNKLLADALSDKVKGTDHTSGYFNRFDGQSDENRGAILETWRVEGGPLARDSRFGFNFGFDDE